MKKSEKIEIRISPDDKEALAKRAEAEGKPASEVVRELLQSGGVTARAEAVPERRGLLGIAAAAGLGVGLLAGAVGSTVALRGGEPDVGLVFGVQLLVEEKGFTTTRYLEGSATTSASELDGASVFLPVGAGSGYRLTVAAPGDARRTQTLTFDLCRLGGGECVTLGSPQLTTKVAGSIAEAEAFGDDGETFTIKIIGRAARA